MKTTLYWVLAVVITIAAAYYQRKTGPTRPKKVETTINSTNYTFKLLRTHGGDEDHEISLEIPDTTIEGKVFYKRYPTNDDWTDVQMTREDDLLKANLPQQPPAGKLAYYIQIYSKNEIVDLSSDNPIIIRFKGSVPAYIMLPHILLMFLAMLLSNLAGLLAAVKHKRHIFYGKITLLLFFIGGMILGPVVQFHAFGEAWTGVPFGWDLTDNKTLISFIFWIVAVAMNWKKNRPGYTILAAVVLLLVYSIPHSMFGSELDYSSGEVTQGFINLIR
jgi:hypothetical protein